jgi:hypothetical protein
MKFRFFGFALFFFTCFNLIPCSISAQMQLRKNPHVDYHVRIIENHYIISYSFLNPFDDLETFSVQFPVDKTDQMIDIFGIPAVMFQPFLNSPDVLAQRQQTLEKGLFLLRDNIIEVDKSAAVELYSELFCRPVAAFIIESLEKYGLDNRHNRIEYAMRFVQDIPYGIPKYNDRIKHYGGVFPPPKILIEGYGDCDSKAILFAGILIYLIGAEDIVFLNQSDHVLSAVRGAPDKGMTYIRYGGDTFLIAETAGPARRKLGEKGKYFQTRHIVEPLSVKHNYVYPVVPTDSTLKANAATDEMNELFIILQNTSGRSLRIQVSTDNTKWKQIMVAPNQNIKVFFEKNSSVMVRFRENSSNYKTQHVEMGTSFSFIFNPRKGIWSLEPM